jgi:hypothetical protein
MAKIKTRAARKAAKLAARHAARGVVSKTRRSPARSLTLFVTGAGTGAVLALLTTRLLSPAPDTGELTDS